jgi:hypothetical protein
VEERGVGQTAGERGEVGPFRGQNAFKIYPTAEKMIQKYTPDVKKNLRLIVKNQMTGARYLVSEAKKYMRSIN